MDWERPSQFFRDPCNPQAQAQAHGSRVELLPATVQNYNDMSPSRHMPAKALSSNFYFMSAESYQWLLIVCI